MHTRQWRGARPAPVCARASLCVRARLCARLCARLRAPVCARACVCVCVCGCVRARHHTLRALAPTRCGPLMSVFACTTRVHRCCTEIEQIVIELQANQASHAHTTDTKQHNSIRNKEKNLRKAIDPKARQLTRWQKMGGFPETPLTQTQLSAMIAGGPAPWGPASEAGVSGRNMYHGQRLCMAAADIARLTEERQVLPLHAERVRCWLAYMTSLIQSETANLPPPPPDSAATAQTAFQQHVAASEATRHQWATRFWLQERLLQLQTLQGEISKAEKDRGSVFSRTRGAVQAQEPAPIAPTGGTQWQPRPFRCVYPGERRAGVSDCPLCYTQDQLCSPDGDLHTCPTCNDAITYEAWEEGMALAREGRIVEPLL